MKNLNKPPTEKAIMLGIMQALGFKDWRVIKMPPSIYTSGKGVPDLLCMKWGITVWIEVKGKEGKLSKEQARFGQMIDDAGGVYIVARSVDYAVEKLDKIEIAICDSKGAISQTIKPVKGMKLITS